jgi:anaerobic magnesium-protoporphyrin IX monomethyl ester cyclase
MKILIVWPPHIPTYFNAGHRLHLFMVGSYLRRSLPSNFYVKCMDFGALNKTWREVSMMLTSEQFDIIVIMNEYGIADAIAKTVRYIRQLSPSSRIITFGRLSSQIPLFFRQYALNAIVHSGDWEAGVLSYIEWLMGTKDEIPGVSVYHDNSWWDPSVPGIFLSPESWAFPDVNEIPYSSYNHLYLDDGKKFCGIPERRELVVLVARGCPVNCHFCEIPRQQGLQERRRSVDSVIDYIEQSFAIAPFEYISMYAPTFTLNRSWVNTFCKKLSAKKRTYFWKCVTTLFHLDEELVRIMAQSGCVRISVGLETLDPDAKSSLPHSKQVQETQFYKVAKWCRSVGIELNCFIILGLPGQTITGATYTIEEVRKQDARVRPSIYTPYHELSSDMDEETVMSYDRQFFLGDFSPEEVVEFYRLAFDEEIKPTKIMHKICTKEV